MYTIVKSVIENGIYELTDILKKIDTQWVQGNITDTEREKLIALARENANMQNSIDIMAKLEELDRRVKALEEAEVIKPDAEEYPEYEVGKWYYRGNKITFEQNRYECIAPEGVVCTWSPSEYPAYWKNLDSPLTA